MAHDVVGLKIGASRLRAARVAMNGGARLVQVASEPLTPGIVTGGEVRDSDALAAALQGFFEKHKLPRRAVRVGVASNRIGVRVVTLTGIEDPRQLANAVRFRAQEALPIPINEAVLDFQMLAETTSAEGPPTRRVLLAVAYRDLVDAYAHACRLAGLRLAGIDLEAFALLRSLTPAAPPPPGGEESALVAVAIGSQRSTFAVSDGYTCEFTRVLDWGGGALTAALAQGLSLDLPRAERLKSELSLDSDTVPEGLAAEQAAQARSALAGALQGFARELVSSLRFYQGQPGSLAIREIVVAGGAAQLGGLASMLQQLIGITVRVGDPLAGVAVAGEIDVSERPALAVPIGLGMAIQ